MDSERAWIRSDRRFMVSVPAAGTGRPGGDSPAGVEIER